MKESCERYQDLRKELKIFNKNIRGKGNNYLEATSITINCSIYNAAFIRGKRVELSLYQDTGEYAGTIIGLGRNNKIKVYLDKRSGKKNAVIKVFADRLTLLNESSVDICPGCDTPIDMEKSPGFLCEQQDLCQVKE